jgi:aryl-alcohol dehydrogenase-like predicted oxidoreductase
MKTDYVDIMQLHNPPADVCEQAGLVDALREMRQQGKARFISISSTLPHLPTYLKWGVFDSFQIPYSALEREHEEWIAEVGKAGSGVIVRGGVAKGEPGVGLGRADRWEKFEAAQLDELCEPGEARTSLLLRYTLTHPHAHTIIVGTLHPEHLAENVQAISRGPLSPVVYAEAKRRLAVVGVVPTPVA